MIFYTSDLHIGHKNVLRFDDRPFADIDEMESEIIRLWNEKVSDEDDIYILGDVFYRYKKDMAEFLYSLKGRLHLIVGNHDDDMLKNEKAASRFESVDKLTKINDNGRFVVLCHFPLVSWDKKQHGTYHVYGHVHSNINDDTLFMMTQERAFNAGCMINGYVPCTLEQLEKNNALFRKRSE